MPTENRLFGTPATFSIQSSHDLVKKKKNIPSEGDLYVESFVSLAQEVAEKTDFSSE